MPFYGVLGLLWHAGPFMACWAFYGMLGFLWHAGLFMACWAFYGMLGFELGHLWHFFTFLNEFKGKNRRSVALHISLWP